MAPSKTFNIAGEHFSVAVCSDPQLANRLTNRMHSLFLGTDLLATTVALAAYHHGRQWVQDLTAYLSAQACHIDEVFKRQEPRLKFVRPSGSFIGLIDCRAIKETIRSRSAIETKLVDGSIGGEGGMLSRFFGIHAAVAMNDGTWFGDDYGDFVRFNYGAPRQLVDQALNRIIRSVEQLYP
jgi:cystathionine beta-lyase